MIEQNILESQVPETQEMTEYHLQLLLKKGIKNIDETKNGSQALFKLLLHRRYDPKLLKKLEKVVLSKNIAINLNQKIIQNSFDNLFENIIFLNLGGNFINNIESLTYLNLPNLRFLYLFQNKCISIKSFCKGNFKSLSYLNFAEGQVKSLKGIQRSDLPQIQAIIAYENKIHTFYELFKLNSTRNKYIMMGDEFQIQNECRFSYTRMLKRDLFFK